MQCFAKSDVVSALISACCLYRPWFSEVTCVQHRIIRIDSPGLRPGKYSCFELIFLDIHLLLDETGTLTMNGKASAASRDERPRLQRDDRFAIAQNNLEEVNSRCSVALFRQRCLHSVGNSKQQKSLIDEMRAQVVE